MRWGHGPCCLAAAVLLALAGPVRAAEPADAKRGLDLLKVIEMTLEHDPNIKLVESRLASARGALTSAKGTFDPLVTAAADRSEIETPSSGTSVAETTTLGGSVGLAQLLRGGLSLAPEVVLERSGTGASAANLATVSFTVRQPLLRGRGSAAVAAGERSAEQEVEAARLDLEQRIAERLLAVVSQYWTLRAAVLDLEVLRVTEERSRELLETTRRLIAADVTPAAEILQLEADLTSKEANRIAGERSLFRARQDLGREIGLDPQEIAELAGPGEAFPTIEPEDVPRPEESAAFFIEQALARRADLGAARRRLTAAEILLAAADDALEPQLDLVLTPSYTGLVEGSDAGDFFSPLLRNVPGLSTSFGLSLSWPIRNRRAEGERIRAEAGVAESALAVELLVKAIGADVPAALDAVRQSARQLARISRSVGFFEKTLENEIKKLRAGTSTLIDVITQRDRLTAVRQQRVVAQLALAQALAELRFETGTLFEAGADRRSITREQLTTLPF